MKLNSKRISRDIIAIILLLATITPTALHTTRAQNLTTSFTYAPTQPARTETISFNATANGGSPPYSFSWAFGDGITATGTTVSHSSSSSGTYTATPAAKASPPQ